MLYRLCNYKGKKLCETNTIEEMNDFIQRDGADYNVVKIESYNDNICIIFESGLQLFIKIEKTE